MIAVVLTLLAFYGVELARRHGYHLHLLSATQQQAVISVFTQTDEQRAAVAVASSMHVRRNDEYLPPLNKSLLHVRYRREIHMPRIGGGCSLRGNVHMKSYLK
eukprot:scaffold5589_cov115-Isochrysis_galbana.AAC.7